MGYKILAVSSDPDFCGRVRACAAHGEHSMDAAENGTQAMRILRETPVDLVLLDSQLPDMAGLAWLSMARQTERGQRLPVIFSSTRRTEAEVAEAFELGADDYVLKNCDALELAARVRAVLRRRFDREERLGAPMTLGPIFLDPPRHICRVREHDVHLRPREYELLEILMRKAGRVLSRAYLLESIWGMSGTANTRAVDVGVSRLRLALGRRASRWIETVERFGYRFREPAG